MNNQEFMEYVEEMVVAWRLNRQYESMYVKKIKGAAQSASALNTTSASTPLPCDGCHLEYGCIECSTCGVWINRKRK